MKKKFLVLVLACFLALSVLGCDSGYSKYYGTYVFSDSELVDEITLKENNKFTRDYKRTNYSTSPSSGTYYIEGDEITLYFVSASGEIYYRGTISKNSILFSDDKAYTKE
ncbi:MAG: hypothetical protein LBS99_03565 [Clostridiales bacterium]|jgi:hypothetical protein|nr:hypothetical protein [Clostridiales bacterium]